MKLKIFTVNLFSLSFLSRLILLLGVAMITHISEGQVSMGNLGAHDLTRVRSQDISDEQLKAMIERGRAEGISPQDALNLARARGLSPTVANELMQRIRVLERANNEVQARTALREEELNIEEFEEIEEIEEIEDTIILEVDTLPYIFGSSLFKNAVDGFEPSMNIPTPVNYTLGSGDELVIDIWGATTNLHQLVVSPEGTITIENLGPLFVHGLTIQEAERRIIRKLQQLYRGLSPGEPGQTTFARVSLGRVRTIQVTVIGEANVPGTFTVSSLATVFNVLFLAQGPSRIGSYRAIEVIRGGEIVARLDIYDLLLRGDQTDNIRLHDQDLVRIATLGNRVEIAGEIQRPALYEVVNGETLADLIHFAGQFTDSAYSRRVIVRRNTDTERKLVTVEREYFSSFNLQNGDRIIVDPILERFANRVSITGAIWRPGDYQLTDGLTLSGLIHKAEGLKPEAFRSRGVINRLDENHDFSILAFNADQVLSNPASDIILHPEDNVIIQSIHDMREAFTVSLAGEVRQGGDFQYRGGMTLGDLILMGQGFLPSASESRIEINRRIIGEPAPVARGTKLAETFMFAVDRNLAIVEMANEFQLQPFDQVFVRARPDYQVQQTITVEGEVMFPGIYALTDRNERISSIISRAGGITLEAFTRGATLLRAPQQLERVEAVLAAGVDEVIDVERRNENFIGIDMCDILANPGGDHDLFLRPGDVIRVPAELQTVRISGGVLRDTEIRYVQGRNLRYYVNRSGGFSQDARRNRAYVVNANGNVDTRSQFLFFGISPEIEPGAEIIIPQRVERPPLTPGERISIFGSLASIAIVVSTLLMRF